VTSKSREKIDQLAIFSLLCLLALAALIELTRHNSQEIIIHDIEYGTVAINTVPSVHSQLTLSA
jgi:hypothetical protein